MSSQQEQEDIPIKQEPSNHKNSATIDKGHYKHSDVFIDEKLNKKVLLKIDSMKLKDKDQFFSWYKEFTLHCLVNGVYMPQIKCLEKDITMELDWNINYI
eukprot:8461422-Ditylum_brightwellii.AAC.1